MTKLTFQMTADEFYEGWKYKLKKNNRNNKKIILLFSLLAVFLCLSIYIKEYFFIFYLFLFAGFLIFNSFMQKKSIVSQFNSSPILAGEQTAVLYEEGIEFINSYEKMFVPWQSIYAVKQERQSLIILPTYRKGLFVISLERYKGSELDAIICALQKNVKIEEGRK